MKEEREEDEGKEIKLERTYFNALKLLLLW